MANNNLDYSIKNCLSYIFSKKQLKESTVGASDFVRRIYSHIDYDFQHTYPVNATWFVTSACNLRCRHCYHYEKENLYSDKYDLNTEQMLKTGKYLAEYFEIFQLTLSGGEPFIRDDIFDLIKLMKNHNIALYIHTNGLLLNSSKIKKLSTLLNPYVDIIQVSLEGSKADINDKMRGAGTYEKIINCIKELRKNNITVNVNTTITKNNIEDLCNITKLCNLLGVYQISYSKLQEDTAELKKLRVEDEDLIIQLSKLIDLEKEQNLSIKQHLNIFSFVELVNNKNIRKYLEMPEYYKLVASQEFHPDCVSCHLNDRIHISSRGKVYLCQASVYKDGCLGDLKRTNLDTIWKKRFKNPLFEIRTKEKMWCRDCKFLSVCKAGCSACAFKCYKTIYAPDSKCKYYFEKK